MDDVVVIYDLIKSIPDTLLKDFFCMIMQVIEDPELPIHETVISIQIDLSSLSFEVVYKPKQESIK